MPPLPLEQTAKEERLLEELRVAKESLRSSAIFPAGDVIRCEATSGETCRQL